MITCVTRLSCVEVHSTCRYVLSRGIAEAFFKVLSTVSIVSFIARESAEYTLGRNASCLCCDIHFIALAPTPLRCRPHASGQKYGRMLTGLKHFWRGRTAWFWGLRLLLNCTTPKRYWLQRELIPATKRHFVSVTQGRPQRAPQDALRWVKCPIWRVLRYIGVALLDRNIFRLPWLLHSGITQCHREHSFVCVYLELFVVCRRQ